MENRKTDHINLAFASRVVTSEADTRFYYEPLLSGHPVSDLPSFAFAGKTMRLPVWVSSMTGGSNQSGIINRRLATVCREFGMGMGLGSCRILLDDEKHLKDFDVREFLGNEQPLYANLGICQLEHLIDQNRLSEIDDLVSHLHADGIIIHINPLQEAFQPEGDQLNSSPADLLDEFLKNTRLRVIVKEVGQGMGPASLYRLMHMPIEAIEFGALGGTNFALLEQMRNQESGEEVMKSFTRVGHTADEMLGFINQIVVDNQAATFPQLIISGGIVDPLDGYRLVKKSSLPAVYGMGAMFLKQAMIGEEALRNFVIHLKQSWLLAESFLKIR